jgi:phospholipid/cholesterol/gamma-HCH transport system substrate-binding protein
VQKQAPSFGRILVMVLFALSVFGLLLWLWLSFGGSVPLAPKQYEMHVRFGEAAQLAEEADVRIAGVPVGKVKKKDLYADGTDATIAIDSAYAPIPKDAKAILRQKTLLGETYVELTQGNRRAGMVPDGGRLASTRVSPTVELDEILRTFDHRTRVAVRTWMEQSGIAYQGGART